jgi:hypothetical protein
MNRFGPAAKRGLARSSPVTLIYSPRGELLPNKRTEAGPSLSTSRYVRRAMLVPGTQLVVLSSDFIDTSES